MKIIELPLDILTKIIAMSTPEDIMELRSTCNTFQNAIDYALLNGDYLHRA